MTELGGMWESVVFNAEDGNVVVERRDGKDFVMDEKTAKKMVEGFLDTDKRKKMLQQALKL